MDLSQLSEILKFGKTLLITIFLIFFILQLLVVSLFQLIGGKSIAKLDNAKFGSALLIGLFTLILVTVVTIIMLFSGFIFQSILLSFILLIICQIAVLILFTELIWKTLSFSAVFKASSINIIIYAIFMITTYLTISDALSKISHSLH